MLQIELSRLQLTKIVTLMPYFLFINKTSRQLSYMEQNEQADLWQDIDPDQVRVRHTPLADIHPSMITPHRSLWLQYTLHYAITTHTALWLQCIIPLWLQYTLHDYNQHHPVITIRTAVITIQTVLWLQCTLPVITMHSVCDYNALRLWLLCTLPVFAMHSVCDYNILHLWLQCTLPLITMRSACDYSAVPSGRRPTRCECTSSTARATCTRLSSWCATHDYSSRCLTRPCCVWSGGWVDSWVDGWPLQLHSDHTPHNSATCPTTVPHAPHCHTPHSQWLRSPTHHNSPCIPCETYLKYNIIWKKICNRYIVAVLQ